jgi:uncharacterized protein YndB with AHSA1/START domain
MSTSLQFDFTVDKAKNTISILREFSAGLSLVWDAFTKQEILDQWGAPEPWIVKTKYMNFKIGGRRLYSMESPEGQEHWSIQEFTSISPKTNFKMLTNFSDRDGNINTEFNSSENNLEFSEANGITTVRITIKYATPAVLEMMIEKGFREGFTMTMNNLEKLLTTLSEK